MVLRLLAALALAMPAGISLAQRVAAASLPVDYPLALVEPGMSGYALTAAAGNVIERFEVTVLGVLDDAGNGFPLVLVRASGPFIESVGGVAAGMSGSPVYLPFDGEDALLGAIGYVFPEADHSVAMVTPIAAMRDGSLVAGGPDQIVVAGYGVALPVATPILLSGADARSASLLEPLFANVAVSPFPSQVGGLASGDAAFSLEPGAALAVRLMSGAFDLSAIGTLTTLEAAAGDTEVPPAAGRGEGVVTRPVTAGHSFLAFGHPFLGTGAASYAVSGAHVLAILSSSNVPFKLANAGRELIGAVLLDTPTALQGAIGATADSIPLSVSVSGGGRQERFELNLAADDRLYPTLTAIAALQASDRLLRATGPGHADLAWMIELTGGRRLNVLEQTSSDTDIAYAAALLASGPLALLASNAFEVPGLVAIELNIDLDRDRNSATVESLVLEEDPVRAGDNAVLHVRLQPYRKPALVRTFSVPLPADLAGELTLLVRGGDIPREIEGVEDEGGETAEPRSFAELLDALRQQLQASELVVEVIDEYGEVKRLARVALPFVVLGSQELTIEVAAQDSGSGRESNPTGEGSVGEEPNVGADPNVGEDSNSEGR